MLFYRPLQQSVNTDPHPLTELNGGTATADQRKGEHANDLLSNTFGEF